jgi:TRAP-type mannitol/chloroaromatic compound transport system substrate-binding protein
MTATELNAWIYHNGGQQLWDDFKGLKFRMPGIGGEVLKRRGAVVFNLPGGEVFPALESGAIDGTEWVCPWNDLVFGLYKIVNITTIQASMSREPHCRSA